jgi:hypothetical protein
MRKIVALLALMLVGLAVSNAAPNGVSVEVSLEQTQFLPGEDCTVAVRITNVSGRDLELGNDNQWLTFTVLSDRGTLVPASGEVPVSGKFTVHSAQVATRRVNITPYFGIAGPGRYRVTATVNLQQWKQQVTSKPATFMVMTGVKIVDAPELEFGVPPKAGDENQPPEIRRYLLEKASYVNTLRLYLRVTDVNGKTLHVQPIDRMVSFSNPEAQIDGKSNLHVLHQTGARDFNYSVLNPDGELVSRQTYQYTATRPTLRKDTDGKVYIAGGIRLISSRDYPTATASIAAPKTDAPTATP